MNKLEVLTREQVPAATQEVYDALKSKIGMVPNLYASVANSPKALTALLTLGENLSGGEFSGKEVEAIALAVGQSNNCEYCLAAHTAIGKMNGFSEDDTISLRTGEVGDSKLNALTNLAKSITETRGLPEAALIEKFYEVGYSEAALTELIGLVALNTFTNYFNHIAQTKVDFPAAPVLATT